MFLELIPSKHRFSSRKSKFWGVKNGRGRSPHKHQQKDDGLFLILYIEDDRFLLYPGFHWFIGSLVEVLLLSCHLKIFKKKQGVSVHDVDKHFYERQACLLCLEQYPGCSGEARAESFFPLGGSIQG